MRSSWQIINGNPVPSKKEFKWYSLASFFFSVCLCVCPCVCMCVCSRACVSVFPLISLHTLPRLVNSLATGSLFLIMRSMGLGHWFSNHEVDRSFCRRGTDYYQARFELLSDASHCSSGWIRAGSPNLGGPRGQIWLAPRFSLAH